jgi:Dyp-type peroxidase family
MPSAVSDDQHVTIDLHDVQGLGIGGFRKDTQELFALTLGPPDAARRLLVYLARRSASAFEVRAFNEAFSSIRRRTGEGVIEATWVGAAISARGYAKLGVDVGLLSAAFQAGMAGRAAQTGDDPSTWRPEFRADAGVDALIVVAADAVDDLDRECDRVAHEIGDAGCTCVFRERGTTLSRPLRGHEHFGFKDGISQPAIAELDQPPAPGEPPAAPVSEFLLGPEAGAEWANGSFLVFRRLHQDVAAFRAMMSTLAPQTSPALTTDQLAAKFVGRWPSGTATATSPDSDPGHAGVTNAFGYAEDADGQQTPRFAHIRKANPRDEPRPDTGTDDVERHRMLRRGIPYGDPLPTEATQDDGAQRGLHFIAIVADPERQFEVVQRQWLNDPNFPNGGTPNQPGGPYTPPIPGEAPDGPDPIVGEHPAEAAVALHQGAQIHALALGPDVVRVTGGEYFFLPSISALHALAVAGNAPVL